MKKERKNANFDCAKASKQSREREKKNKKNKIISVRCCAPCCLCVLCEPASCVGVCTLIFTRIIRFRLLQPQKKPVYNSILVFYLFRFCCFLHSLHVVHSIHTHTPYVRDSYPEYLNICQRARVCVCTSIRVRSAVLCGRRRACVLCPIERTVFYYINKMLHYSRSAYTQ